MSAAALNVVDVRVTFDATPALDGVTLEVPAGAWLVIIGPNGAGKTTLLRAICAALPVDEGVVLWEDQRVAALPARERARGMAVTPQGQEVPSGWTVEQVVAQGRSPYLGLWRSAGPADREAVAAALHDTDTAVFASRPVETLSGGERQRVLLARALAQTPRLLLLDEPTAFLDLQYQWEMLELVEHARKERGLTVVSVLHDLNLAAAFATQIALLQSGCLTALGTPGEVLTEARIAEAYGRRVTVARHPATGRPTVLPWPDQRTRASAKRIHVVSGGGTGAALLRHLTADGHHVSAGVLNIGDSDWEAARALGLEIVEEAPFSAISSVAAEEAARLLRRADAVIVAPMPIGPGNLENLRLAETAAKEGRLVILVGEMRPERDFTAGDAATLWAGARNADAVVVEDLNAAIAALNHEPGSAG